MTKLIRNSHSLFILSLFILISCLYPLPMAKAEDDPLTVTTGSTADELVQCILGDGVSYENAQLHAGIPECVGIFTGGLDEVGFSEGIILSNGNAKKVEKSDNITGKENNTTGGGADLDLNDLLSVNSNDACYLTFDIIPTHNALSFQYVLASEEYEDCIHYADLFALFYAEVKDDGSIDNDGYHNHNMAWVPDTDPKQPVSIVTVNQNVNSQFYRSNYGINAGNIDSNMDGFTTVFTVNQTLVAGTKYRIKIAIADVADTEYDTNVFIKANSVQDTAAQYGEISPKSKLENPTTYDVIIARENGSDGSAAADWQALDADGHIIASGTVLFNDGETEKTITVPIATVTVRLLNASGGITIKASEALIDELPDTGADIPDGNVDLMGTLLDDEGNPLANMTITLHSTPVTTTTDSAGEFVFHDITLENHELIIVDGGGTELKRFNLTFSDSSAFSYSIDGNNVDILMPDNTINLEVTLNVNDEGVVSISNISHYAPADNPKTGDSSPLLTPLVPLMLILLLSLGVYMVNRKKVK